MSKVFLSYRRDDSAGYAGRLYDRLASQFGVGQVFMDIDHIEPGEDFVEVIQKAMGASKVLVVLIGRQWATALDQNGLRRLDNPNDFVRLEVNAALDRNIRIIPVLIGGARMPAVHDIPQSLHLLTQRQAIELSDLRFHSDVDRLIDVIEKILAPQATHAHKADAERAVLVNSLQSERSRAVESRVEELHPANRTVHAASRHKWRLKLWAGRFFVLAAIGFAASLGFAWMLGAEVSNGVSYPYISSPGFWEVDIWLLWPIFTIVAGVLFAAGRYFRKKMRKVT